jgi:hypothetical protein
MSCFAGYFSISGAVYFIIFIIHSYAYYGFRSKYHIHKNIIYLVYDEPIDMITPVRKLNKTNLPREIFKWLYMSASALYFIVEIIGSILIEYNEIRGML